MRHYLVVFDRRMGQIVRSMEYAQASDALSGRFEAEAEFRSDRNIEVVVLGAKSWDALQTTHARYFQNPRQLASDAFETLRDQEHQRASEPQASRRRTLLRPALS